MMPSFQALFLVLTWVRQARAFPSEFKESSIDFGQGQMVQRICEAAEKAKVELLITQTEITGKTTTAVTSTPVTTVTFCNPHQRIPESSASFPSPQAQSRNPTLIPNSERPFPIMLNHSRTDQAQPDCLYLSLISSSSLSLISSHTLSLPLSRSLRLTLLVLHLRQPYTT